VVRKRKTRRERRTGTHDYGVGVLCSEVVGDGDGARDVGESWKKVRRKRSESREKKNDGEDDDGKKGKDRNAPVRSDDCNATTKNC
jgi:hypothetical protein